MGQKNRVQRAQAAILNDITESHQFNKIKMAQKPKDIQMKQTMSMKGQQHPCRYCSGIHAPRQCPAIWKDMCQMKDMGHFRKVCQSRRDQAVHELEVKGVQEVHKGEIETVSVDSVHLNKNRSLITANSEMQTGENVIEIPYKSDTGSEGNIMLLYIFKKLFRNTTEEQLKRSIKSHIRLRMYNKTSIMQLGMCEVIIKFKNFKKRCVFFVVPGNGQALLGMPDTAALQIININIDSIQAEVAECKTNIKQEIHTVMKGLYKHRHRC